VQAAASNQSLARGMFSWLATFVVRMLHATTNLNSSTVVLYHTPTPSHEHEPCTSQQANYWGDFVSVTMCLCK
jgi:hypothetical protein